MDKELYVKGCLICQNASRCPPRKKPMLWPQRRRHGKHCSVRRTSKITADKKLLITSSVSDIPSTISKIDQAQISSPSVIMIYFLNFLEFVYLESHMPYGRPVSRKRRRRFHNGESRGTPWAAIAARKAAAAAAAAAADTGSNPDSDGTAGLNPSSEVKKGTNSCSVVIAPSLDLLRPGYSTGVWPLRERLLLASSLLDTDNRQLTWPPISRRLSKFTPPSSSCGFNARPSTWCSAKACAKQYSLLLESAEMFRKQQFVNEIELRHFGKMSRIDFPRFSSIMPGTLLTNSGVLSESAERWQRCFLFFMAADSSPFSSFRLFQVDVEKSAEEGRTVYQAPGNVAATTATVGLSLPEFIVKRLTVERIEELRTDVLETRKKHRTCGSKGSVLVRFLVHRLNFGFLFLSIEFPLPLRNALAAGYGLGFLDIVLALFRHYELTSQKVLFICLLNVQTPEVAKLVHDFLKKLSTAHYDDLKFTILECMEEPKVEFSIWLRNELMYVDSEGPQPRGINQSRILKHMAIIHSP
ncbi:hypothetical protein ACTXT7_007782 [Hymenolepis weldensis]